MNTGIKLDSKKTSETKFRLIKMNYSWTRWQKSSCVPSHEIISLERRIEFNDVENHRRDKIGSNISERQKKTRPALTRSLKMG